MTMTMTMTMIWRIRRLGSLAACLAAGAAGAEPLTVCMAQDNAPLSYQVAGQARGLDMLIARAIADELKRELKTVLFESEYDAGKPLSHQVNAMLSSGVCDLASGFPLIANDLGAPSRPTARVPDYPGALRPPQRPWVPLGTLVPSRAYHAVAMGLVVRDAVRETATLADAGDARIGVTAGTMSGTVVTLYRNGKLRQQLVSVSQNEDALDQLSAGRFDATLVSLDRFDAWRLTHPGSPLRRAAYVHPLRINIGYVARSDAQDVLAAANRVITGALANGDLQRWSTAAGSTWIAPTEPEVSGPIGLAQLMQE